MKVMQASTKLWALVLSAVLVGGCLTALAQEKMAMNQDDAQARLEHLSKELNLTDAQKDKLKPILESEATDWKAVHDNTSLTPMERRAKMKEIHDKYAPQINGVLTPEQQAKWKQMKQEAWQKHKENMGKSNMNQQ
jgi:Spy/CpxP family protein refolding chaperone